MALFLAYDPSTNPLNTNEWAFPVCEVLHILGFAIGIGTITMINIRLMGLGLKKETPAELWKGTFPWTLGGLAMVLITGPLIFSSDPNMYLRNEGFRFKITMLVLALLFHFTIYRKIALTKTSGGAAVMAGLVSVLLWMSVIFGGIFIAFL